MARKIDAPKKKRTTANEVEVLHPKRTLMLAGREVTVREYGFFASFEVYAIAEPLLADLTDAVAMANGAPWTQVMSVLAQHRDCVLQLLQRACDVDVDWLTKLGDADGQALLMTWWGVNGPFFMRRAVTTLAIRARATAQSAGPKSSPPSSATDTAPATSAATPPAS